MIISRLILLRMRNISDRICRENKNTLHVKIFLSNIAPLLNNGEKYCRAGQATDDNIIWRMGLCCINTARTQTKKCNTYSTTIVKRPCLNISLLGYCPSCFDRNFKHYHIYIYTHTHIQHSNRRQMFQKQECFFHFSLRI